MATPYEILMATYQMLEYDLQTEIDKYAAELVAHAMTLGEPAPIAISSMVEGIVKYHDGLFVITLNPEPKEKRPLPKDAKYYKTKTDKTAMEAEVEQEAKDKADFEIVKGHRLTALTNPVEEELPPDMHIDVRLDKLEAQIAEIHTLLKKHK